MFAIRTFWDNGVTSDYPELFLNEEEAIEVCRELEKPIEANDMFVVYVPLDDSMV